MRRAKNIRTDLAILIGPLFVGLFTGMASASAEEQPSTAEQRAFVQSKVLPLLEARCFECHGGTTKPKGGLVPANRQLLLKGGDSGPSVVPGKPDESLLIEAVRYEGLEMAPRSKMPEAEIRILIDWVQMGTPWPEGLQDSRTRTAPSVERTPGRALVLAADPKSSTTRSPEYDVPDRCHRSICSGSTGRRRPAARVIPETAATPLAPRKFRHSD